MKEFYKTINNKKYHIVYIHVKYGLSNIFNYENKGYTMYDVFCDYARLYKEV